MLCRTYFTVEHRYRYKCKYAGLSHFRLSSHPSRPHLHQYPTCVPAVRSLRPCDGHDYPGSLLVVLVMVRTCAGHDSFARMCHTRMIETMSYHATTLHRRILSHTLIKLTGHTPLYGFLNRQTQKPHLPRDTKDLCNTRRCGPFQ